MSIPKRAPSRVRVDSVLERNEMTVRSSGASESPFMVKGTRYPYDVMLSGINKDGSTFKLTFNAYEMKAERQENQEVETITRYYSNHCVLVQTRRMRGTRANEVMEKWRTAQKTLKRRS